MTRRIGETPGGNARTMDDDPTTPADAGEPEQDEMHPQTGDSQLEQQDADTGHGSPETPPGGNPGGLGVPPPPG